MRQKKFKRIYFIFFLFFIRVSFVYSAEHVLPYPSYMPGNKLYTISRIVDKFSEYWYWGTIAQFRYQLGLADKYLVEAKILFEYKQYLLAVDALKRSDEHFSVLPMLVKKAVSEGKDTQEMTKIYSSAAKKHEEILNFLKHETPSEFNWTPEKTAPTMLSLHQLFNDSLEVRLNTL